MEIHELVTKYISGYDLLVKQLEQIPSEAMHFKPAPDKWSISEVIIHLADSEAHGFVRAKKIIAESGGRVTVYNQQIWADNLFYGQMNYEDALEMIRVLRKNLYEVLKLLKPREWNNYIFHPESGKITLLDWIQLYIDHIEIHIQQIHRNFYDWRKANEKEFV